MSLKKKTKLILAKHLDDTEAVLVELMTYNFKKWIIRSVPGNSISENGAVRSTCMALVVRVSWTGVPSRGSQ